MPIKYILDTREKGLQDIFTEQKISFEVKQLDLGDLLIVYSKSNIEQLTDAAKKLLSKDEEKEQDPVYTFVFERKSHSDLKSSISDGRYREQKQRYMKLPVGSVFYLLEDDGKNALEYKQFLGMYIHTIIRDKIPVFLTKSINNTAEFILKIGETLEEFGVESFQVSESKPEKTQIKKHKATGAEVYINQLCCFYGVSMTKAKLIASVYPDITSLLSALNDNSFKIKGIGPKLLQTIKDGLLFNK